MHLFPESGFDQNAITPVFLGVLVAWFFTETLGWVFAGLVVPGYLATAFVVEPRAAAIDVGEAVVTYVLARLLGEHLSRTGLTSRAFGRERFLLVLVVSVVVRLAVEGVLFARYLPHAHWAYSLGLVVVPLAANACWKTGLLRGFVQNGVPTLVVYLLLARVLVPYTNLSLSGFRLATEDIAGSFLASPKPYLLLLTGGLLAAAANVLWGWDYNGILLPALLTLVLADPRKLFATGVEVVVLTLTVRILVAATPFKRWNIEGPRRTVLFFSVDYLLRFALASAVGRELPAADVVEMTGLGYLVPTLLAVKASQRGSLAVVLLPTATVSAATFIVGTALGFATDTLDPFDLHEARPLARRVGHAPEGLVASTLWLGALARPERARGRSPSPLAARTFARLALAARAGRDPAEPGVCVERDAGYLIVRERFELPRERTGIAAIVLPRTPPTRSAAVVLMQAPLGAPACALAAARLLEAGLAGAIVVSEAPEPLGRDAGEATSGHAVARALEHLLEPAGLASAGSGMLVACQRGSGKEAVLRVQPHAERLPGVDAIIRELVPIERHEGAPAGGEELSLELPPETADHWLQDPPRTADWSESSTLAPAFDGLTRSSREPSFEELLALRRLVLEPLLSAEPEERSTALVRTAAEALDYEVLGPSPLSDGEPALLLEPGVNSPPLALLVRLRGERDVVVEVPHWAGPGASRLALELSERLRAGAVLVGTAEVGGAVTNEALLSARSLATTSRAGTGLVVVREVEGPGAGGAVGLGTWGKADELRRRTADALATLHFGTAPEQLSANARAEAGLTVLGGVPLVSVSVDAVTLAERGLIRTGGLPAPLAELRTVDLERSAAAAALLGELPEEAPVAPAGLLESARRAALERSIVAARRLESALGRTASRAALARTNDGVHLVVAVRDAAGVGVAAFPLSLTPLARAGGDVTAATADDCTRALESYGTCRVELGR